MVVGMDERPDVRDPFENDVARCLKARGVEGTGSHSVLRFDELKGDKEQIRQRLLAAGAESVLFVQVTDKANFVDGPPISLGSDDWSGVAETRYNALTTPGGNINSAWRLGARVYRISDGAVIWSGLLETVMKEDDDSLAVMRRVAKTIVARLADDKVIP
jgi:hypothetical protein